MGVKPGGFGIDAQAQKRSGRVPGLYEFGRQQLHGDADQLGQVLTSSFCLSWEQTLTTVL